MSTSALNRAGRSRWLDWQPKGQILRHSAAIGPAKPSKPGFEGSVGFPLAASLKIETVPEAAEPESLEAVLKGRAIELWSDSLGERFWLVADEDDAKRLGAPRGEIYTSAEARRVISIGDPKVVAEVHAWKRRFNGKIRDAATETAHHGAKQPESRAL